MTSILITANEVNTVTSILITAALYITLTLTALFTCLKLLPNVYISKKYISQLFAAKNLVFPTRFSSVFNK